MMLVIGTVNLMQAAVSFAYPPPDYAPGPMELKMRITENKNLPAEVVQEQIQLEQERAIRSRQYERIHSLVQAFSMLIVAAPLYWYHWRLIKEDKE